ncbi:MAG: hypothetical protein IPM17_07620 [Verrucomicrobia bacterium]|nr:hypothetical protein [Verrucomicrobiota bacterium]
MNAHTDKLVATVLATLAVGLMAFWSVVPGWALHPPRLGVASATFVPLGHIAMRCRSAEPIVVLLSVGPLVATGSYLGWAWIRGRLPRALACCALLYVVAVGAALVAGIDAR